MSTVHAIDWGDVPTWISAITTLGAFIAAGTVVYIELRRDKRHREAADRAEQADRVAVWHEAKPRSRVVILNGSPLPIHTVTVTFIHNGTAVHAAVDGPVPPGEHRIPIPGVIGPNAGTAGMAIWFDDTAGRSWFREADGTLMRTYGGKGVDVHHEASLRTPLLPPE